MSVVGTTRTWPFAPQRWLKSPREIWLDSLVFYVLGQVTLRSNSTTPLMLICFISLSYVPSRTPVALGCR